MSIWFLKISSLNVGLNNKNTLLKKVRNAEVTNVRMEKFNPLYKAESNSYNDVLINKSKSNKKQFPISLLQRGFLYYKYKCKIIFIAK